MFFTSSEVSVPPTLTFPLKVAATPTILPVNLPSDEAIFAVSLVLLMVFYSYLLY
jgi:hypothetical protein